MSSFLKQAYALEQEVINDVEITDEDAVEVAGETESARQEAEALGSEVERAIAVHDELENQNDTLAEIVEEKGEVTPEVAAVVEVARRTAAAGLGLDPDEEGQDLVNTAGLESMVADKNMISLEEAKKSSKSLWEKIKGLWQAFVQRCKDFWNWLMKMTNFIDKKYKAAYEAIRSMSDEDFEAKVKELDQNSEQYKNVFNFLTPAGGLYDIDREANGLIKTVTNVNNDVLAAIKGAFGEIDKDKGAVIKRVAEKVKGNVVNFGPVTFKIASSNEKGLEVDSVFKQAKTATKLSFSRKDLERTLNVGSGVIRNITEFNKGVNKSINEGEKAIEQAAKAATNDQNAAVVEVNTKRAVAVYSLVGTLQIKAGRYMNEGLKAYLALAKKIIATKVAAKAEK